MTDRTRDYELMMEKMARALRVYANPSNWGDDDWGVRAVFHREYGKPGVRAQRTLERYERLMADEHKGEDA